MTEEQKSKVSAALDASKKWVQFQTDLQWVSSWPDGLPQELEEPPEVPCKHPPKKSPHEIRQRLWEALLAKTNICDQEDSHGIHDGVIDTQSN